MAAIVASISCRRRIGSMPSLGIVGLLPFAEPDAKSGESGGQRLYTGRSFYIGQPTNKRANFPT
jgi:hypothetical protein